MDLEARIQRLEDIEAIKQLKSDVDVLTLTATPIPRTLEMSLTGIRDLTILNTPPADRQPILTYVGEYDERAVAEAIRKAADSPDRDTQTQRQHVEIARGATDTDASFAPLDRDPAPEQRTDQRRPEPSQDDAGEGAPVDGAHSLGEPDAEHGTRQGL